jgi:uncharacterized protein YprB with RNaseH-like and TPR domain
VLTNTFRHIPGISAAVEQRLWTVGVRCWEGCAAAETLPVSSGRRERLRQGLVESREHLAAANARYFADCLPAAEHWRLFPQFRSSVAYLDIETTGLSPMDSYVTTVALYDGRTIRHYVRGDNLDRLGRDIADYRLIVTYNGKCFDVPFLRQSMGLVLDQAHVDLRYVLRSLGYGGGLKGCERQLGIHRGDLEDVDGFFAVLLWEDYRRSGDPRSLETLLAYNIQDVLNLEALLVMAYNLKIGQTPFADCNRLPAPVAPTLPFRADPHTIARLRRQSGWGWSRWT